MSPAILFGCIVFICSKAKTIFKNTHKYLSN